MQLPRRQSQPCAAANACFRSPGWQCWRPWCLIAGASVLMQQRLQQPRSRSAAASAAVSSLLDGLKIEEALAMNLACSGCGQQAVGLRRCSACRKAQYCRWARRTFARGRGWMGWVLFRWALRSKGDNACWCEPVGAHEQCRHGLFWRSWNAQGHSTDGPFQALPGAGKVHTERLLSSYHPRLPLAAPSASASTGGCTGASAAGTDLARL